ncbi:hypothetical protein FIBSPDRAFT_906007, partial [Athelia psychrophila]
AKLEVNYALERGRKGGRKESPGERRTDCGDKRVTRTKQRKTAERALREPASIGDHDRLSAPLISVIKKKREQMQAFRFNHADIIMEQDQNDLWTRLNECLQVKPQAKSTYEPNFWRGWQYEWEQYSTKVGTAILQGDSLPPQADFITAGMATLEAQFDSLDAYHRRYFSNQRNAPLPKDNIWWKDLSLALFPAQSYDDHKKKHERLLQRVAEAKARVESAKAVVSKIEAERLGEVGAFGKMRDVLSN